MFNIEIRCNEDVYPIYQCPDGHGYDTFKAACVVFSLYNLDREWK